MKMFRILAVLAGSVLATVSVSAAAADDGSALFDTHCAACHFRDRNPMLRDQMVAPPIDMMSLRLRQLTGGNRDPFVARVVDYTRTPMAEKSADSMAVQRFGLMPRIDESSPGISDAALTSIANWMFDLSATVRQPGWMGPPPK